MNSLVHTVYSKRQSLQLFLEGLLCAVTKIYLKMGDCFIRVIQNNFAHISIAIRSRGVWGCKPQELQNFCNLKLENASEFKIDAKF